MIMDGIFLHHLVKELKDQVEKQRINKFLGIDNYSFILLLQGKKQLYISISPDTCHLRFTNKEYVALNKLNNFFIILKKHLESSIIKEIKQIENERILEILLEARDDLGYIHNYYLILELFGRNANLFLCDKDKVIIDCFRKSYVIEANEKRIIMPKVKYEYPLDNKINPFTVDFLKENNFYQGMSKLNFTEAVYQGNLDFITGPISPQLIKANNKTYFSAFELKHLNGEVEYFDQLSSLLEKYYYELLSLNIQTNEQKLIENFLNREIIKITKKISKQEIDKQKAKENLNLEKIGNLLSANLYKVKKNQEYIVVEDFYNNNEELRIELNPLISPADNLSYIFNRYKKAKRSIDYIEEQIINSKNDFIYYETLKNQLDLAMQLDLREIIEELGIGKKTKTITKKHKPHFESFQDDLGNQIWVGKNNIQNNYLTHKFAKKSDYFFHVKDIPGSHTILRTTNLTAEIVLLAATIAAYYSKSRLSSNVAVDYTLVRYVKKIPKTKGSNVIYTNFKTIYVNPNLDFIKNNTT